MTDWLQQNWILIVLGIVVLAVAIWWLAGNGSRLEAKAPDAPEALRSTEEPVSPVIVGPAVSPVDVPPVQQMPEPEALVETAPFAAAMEPVTVPSGPADELTRMKGVGPKVAALLNGMGVTRFDQIAAWSDDDVARVDAQLGAFKGRVTRDQWVEQARLLATGDRAAYEAKFGKLG